jgi:hypothetical protein
MNRFNFALTLLAATVVAPLHTEANAPLAKAGAPVLVATNTVRQDGLVPLAVKRNGSGVTMAYSIDGTPSVGNVLTIRIQVFSPVDAQIVLRSNEGLTLITPNVLQSAAGVESLHTVPKPSGKVDVTPSGERILSVPVK